MSGEQHIWNRSTFLVLRQNVNLCHKGKSELFRRHRDKQQCYCHFCCCPDKEVSVFLMMTSRQYWGKRNLQFACRGDANWCGPWKRKQSWRGRLRAVGTSKRERQCTDISAMLALNAVAIWGSAPRAQEVSTQCLKRFSVLVSLNATCINYRKASLAMLAETASAEANAI